MTVTEAVQLSYEQCKQRKTKCDKNTPCSACRASGLPCRPIRRARLPRGKTGKVVTSITIRDKVARLEKLVCGLESQIEGAQVSTSESSRDDSPRSPRTDPDNRIERLAARDFWVALSDEVIGLREMIEASDDDGDDSHRPIRVEQTERLNPLASHAVLFSQSHQYVGLPMPSPKLRQILVHIYRTRVDWLFKILHWPSVSAMLEQDTHMLPSETVQAELVLEYAIYFLASCALLDHEFEDYRLGDKAAFINQYQHATETLLSQAGLLTTTNIVLLQAFVLYIAAIRCSVSGAVAWTLLATAARIAHACNLHSEDSEGYSAFELETRRRLWFSIGFLDTQTSFGRGAIPLLSHQDLNRPPKAINDIEMSSHEVVPRSTHNFTDMAFSSLCHQGTVCQKKLTDPNYGSWQKRLDLANAFELSTRQTFGHFELSSDIRQDYTALVAKSMPVTMQLLLRRPLFRNLKHAIPPDNDYNVLEVGCKVLRTGLARSKSPEFVTLSWFKWPKWFALAVVLVELCSCGPGSSFDDAYLVAQSSYDDFAQSRTDVDSGDLWKPITKLMRRVQRMRERYVLTQFGNSRIETQNTTFHNAGNTEHDHSASPYHTGSSSQDLLPTEPLLVDTSSLTTDSTPADPTQSEIFLQWDLFLNDVNDPFLSLNDFDAPLAHYGIDDFQC